ncbi:cytoplasmic protein [Bacillus coahuilensis m2-6]|uniref:Cytoplasmic protein n=1 Tax=Bacillus coahuilensis p1.1.43 TaxID=1150625 RepID=A0A147KAV4_9BACI|nr:metal-sensitive transcriptional regulator [Bacillus coahuilensis]KUP07919.1 cytoplasmic protein [Bacillus coahuilensis p1.1.43]KUP09328.1 cytoplasmic protein [Bacillus coahuilensis m2-6]
MEYTSDISNRLKRLEGQIRGVLNMMEEDKHCKDVVTQLSAVRSGIDRTIGLIVAKNLQACIVEAAEEGRDAEDAIQEAVNLIVKSR